MEWKAPRGNAVHAHSSRITGSGKAGSESDFRSAGVPPAFLRNVERGKIAGEMRAPHLTHQSEERKVQRIAWWRLKFSL